MITRALLEEILCRYVLPPNGVHGFTHWARVIENGFRIAEQTGADMKIVQLFAVFHDSRRVNETMDEAHGRRGAELAASLCGSSFHLSESALELLMNACSYHTDGLTAADITVQTCWDADRLDLGRAGITPKPDFLCTDAARDPALIQWADERSRQRYVPDLVRTDWGLRF